MRRAIANSLLLIFSWMLFAPLVAQNSDASLPACCRKNGKHHCMMRGMQRLGGKGIGLASVSEKCPCPPDSTGAIHSAKFLPGAAGHFHSTVVCQAACVPQPTVSFRVSFLRGHPKRGPPAPLA
jgi:hypothetical protein